MMKTIASIYEKVVWVVTILVILAVLMISGPKIFGIEPYIILSSSMEPVIQTGSLVYVDKNDTEVEQGDIVTFTIDNGKNVVTVTHRIEEVTPEGYVTKGDNNDVADLDILTPDRIVGTYKMHIPKLGYLMSKITKKVLVVMIGWMAGMHVFGFVLDALADDGKKETEETNGTEQHSPKSEKDL